jgi:hypothetical protein
MLPGPNITHLHVHEEIYAPMQTLILLNYACTISCVSLTGNLFRE